MPPRHTGLGFRVFDFLFGLECLSTRVLYLANDSALNPISDVFNWGSNHRIPESNSVPLIPITLLFLRIRHSEGQLTLVYLSNYLDLLDHLSKARPKLYVVHQKFVAAWQWRPHLPPRPILVLSIPNLPKNTSAEGCWWFGPDQTRSGSFPPKVALSFWRCQKIFERTVEVGKNHDRLIDLFSGFGQGDENNHQIFHHIRAATSL
jgi:hypothetical protein